MHVFAGRIRSKYGHFSTDCSGLAPRGEGDRTMATISKRGNRFRAQVRIESVSQSENFATRADAAKWAKAAEVGIERANALARVLKDPGPAPDSLPFPAEGDRPEEGIPGRIIKIDRCPDLRRPSRLAGRSEQSSTSPSVLADLAGDTIRSFLECLLQKPVVACPSPLPRVIGASSNNTPIASSVGVLISI